MPSAWVQHCKKYASEHGCSYGEALKRAKSTYNPSTMEGGKFSVKQVKKTVNKAVKGAKKGSKMLDKADKFIELVDEDTAEKVRKYHSKAKSKANAVAHLAKEGEEIFKEGEGFNLKKAKHKVVKGARQAKRVSKKVSKVLDQTAPLVALSGNPELAVAMEGVSQGIKQGNRMTGGALGSRAKGKKNPYLNGGSFRVPERHGGSFSVPHSHGGCMSCGGRVPTNSSLVSPYHPSFRPNKEKPFSEKIHTN